MNHEAIRQQLKAHIDKLKLEMYLEQERQIQELAELLIHDGETLL
jgi:hypothetical protein